MKNELDTIFENAENDFFFRTGAREQEIRIALARRIEELRKGQRLSIRDLADRMYTSVSQVERLLNKEVGGGLTLRTMVRASDVLQAELNVWIESIAEGKTCQTSPAYEMLVPAVEPHEHSDQPKECPAPPGTFVLLLATQSKLLNRASCMVQAFALGRELPTWDAATSEDSVLMPHLLEDEGVSTWC